MLKCSAKLTGAAESGNSLHVVILLIKINILIRAALKGVTYLTNIIRTQFMHHLLWLYAKCHRQTINCLPLKCIRISHLSEKCDSCWIVLHNEKTKDKEGHLWGLVWHYGNVVLWNHCPPPPISSKHFFSCKVSLTVVTQGLSRKPLFICYKLYETSLMAFLHK